MGRVSIGNFLISLALIRHAHFPRFGDGILDTSERFGEIQMPGDPVKEFIDGLGILGKQGMVNQASFRRGLADP